MDRTDASFRIDSYKFLPRTMIPEFKAFPYRADDLVKAWPSVALKNARVALLTSGGLYLKDRQSSFEVIANGRNFSGEILLNRLIPRDVRHGEIAVARLHLNPEDILADFNVAPLEVVAELEREGEFGVLAQNNYWDTKRSTEAWHDTYGPELAERLQEDRVNLLILAPT